MREPKDYIVGTSVTVSNLELSTSEARVRDIVHRDARLAIADAAAHLHMKEHKEAYSTTFVCRAYVIPPDDFWRLVELEARRIAARGL